MAFDIRERVKQHSKEQEKEQQDGKIQGRFDVREYSKQKRAGAVAEDISNRVNAWQARYSRLVNDSNSRYSTREEGKYVSDSNDWLQRTTTRRKMLDAEAESIRELMREYNGYLKEDWAHRIDDALRNYGAGLEKLEGFAKQDADYWAQFMPTEEQAAQGYTSESVYNQWYTDNSYRQKYAGQGYDQLTQALSTMADGEEKDWLEAYTLSVATEDELAALRDAADNDEDYFKYHALLNQKQIQTAAQTLAKTQMAGTDGSVLDELLTVAQMEDGAEKKAQKQAVINAMREAGVDPDTYYSLIGGDSNWTAGNLLNMIGSGFATQFVGAGKSVAELLDFTLGKAGRAIGWDNGIGDWAADMRRDYNAYAYNTDLYMNRMGGGTALEAIKDVAGGVGGALPHAIVALATAGTSTGLTLSENAAAATGNLLTKAGLTTEAMLKNPSYWMSFSQTFSNDYEEAKAKGADDVTAAFVATITSLINAGIEIGLDGASGIQGLPQNLADGDKSAILAWVKSSLEEGGEEVLQGFINNAVAKVLYDSSTKLVDPEEMAREFALGTAVGGILGGVQTAAVKGVAQVGQWALQAAANEGRQGIQANAVQSIPGAQTIQAGNVVPVQQVQTENMPSVQQTVQERADTRTAAPAVGNADVQAAQTTAGRINKPQATTGISEQKTGQAAQAGAAESQTTAKATAGKSADMTTKATSKEALPVENELEVSEQEKTVLKETGKAVTIRRIASAKDGVLTLELEGGKTVKAEDVAYSSEGEALIYEAVASLGVDAEIGNLLVGAYRENDGGVAAGDFALGMVDAFQYGMYNIPQRELAENTFTAKLTTQQRNTAYLLGQRFGGKQVATAEAKARRARIAGLFEKARNAGADAGKSPNTGKVRFMDGKQNFDLRSYIQKSGKKLSDIQETAVATMEKLSAVLGVDFYVYESYVKDGKRVYLDEHGVERPAPSGRYAYNGRIFVDLNAGNTGKGTMLYTVAHELTHFIRQWSPAKFKVLANFLMEQFGQKGVSVDTLIRAQMEKAKKNGLTISYDTAYEEVVADSMETMLNDGNVVLLMAELKQQDKTLWQKICDWFKKLAADLQAVVDAYKNHKPDSAEGRMVAQMQDVIVILESLYTDALVQASENYKAAGAQKNTTQEGDVKMQTRSVNGDKVVWIENSGFTNAQLKDPNAIAQYIATHIGEVYKIIESGQRVYIGKDLPGEYTHSKYTSYLQKKNPSALKAKNKAASALGEMIEIATNRRWESTKHKQSKDAKYGMYRYDTKFAFPVKDQRGNVTTVKAYDAELLIRNASDGKKYLYDIVNIKEDTANALDLRHKEARKGNYQAATQNDVYKNSIRNSEADVKEKFSLRDSDYMDAVNNGDMETARKMVEEEAKTAGYTNLFYHGSKKGGGFTKFRDWSYFTESREYAERYTERENKGSLYQTFVKLKKPFDTRNADAKDLFEQIRGEYGLGEIQDTGLPDWTDGYDIADYIDENDLDYDGIILDEGGDLVNGEPVSRGLSYVVRKSAQIKSSDPVTYDDKGNVIPLSERFNEENEDIRYSLRDPTVEKAAEALRKENEKIKEDVTQLKELLKLQRQVTGGTKFTRSSVEAAARYLKQTAAAKGDTAELAQLLNEFYEYIAQSKDLTWESVKEQAQPAAQWLMQHKALEQGRTEYAEDILKELRTSRICLDENQKGEAAFRYGSFNDFRKAAMGTVTVANDGVPLDVKWQEWASLYPDVFDENISATDMPGALMDTVQSLRSADLSRVEAAYQADMIELDVMRQVYDSYWRVSTLKTVADRMQKQINALKSQHYTRMDKLRNEHREITEQLKQEHREQVQRIRQEYRQKREQDQKKVAERNREAKKKAAEGRRKTALRQKIYRHTSELSQKLLKPTDKSHVPEGLRSAVAAMLNAINLESLYTRDAETGKLQKDPEGLPVKRTEAFHALQVQYREILDNDESQIVVDPALQDKLGKVIEMKNVRLGDMDMEQLTTVWELIRGVEASITSAGKLLSKGKYETTDQWADALEAVEKARKPRRQMTKNGMVLDLETPITFFSHFGKPGEAVYRMLRDAQDKQQLLTEKFTQMTQEIVSSSAVTETEKHILSFTTEKGDTLTLSVAHMMELYLLQKQPDALRHLLKGGIVQPEVQGKMRGKAVRLHRGNQAMEITAADLDRIDGALTEKQRKIADKLQEILSVKLAEEGNAASMLAYGYRKFTNKNYWPIKSAKEQIQQESGKDGGQTRAIKNMGAAQQRNPNAINALEIRGIFNTYASHANDMITYAAYLVPMEDCTRLFNYRYTNANEGGERKQTVKTVKGYLSHLAGTGANGYWLQLMDNIQNGFTGKEKSRYLAMGHKAISNAKGAAVAANIRVILQQPTAFLRALAVMDAKDLAAGLVQTGGWKRALEHSPTAMRKAQGGFEIGNTRQMKDILFGTQPWMDKANDFFLKGAAAMDAVTWGRLWTAAEHQVERTAPGLKTDNKAFYAEVNRVFTNVIDETQVMDGVLQRSSLMRMSDSLYKMATSFMGEPTMSLNLFLRNYDRWVYETDKQARAEASKKMERAACALALSGVINAVVQSAVDATRDDDKEHKYLERFQRALTGIDPEEESVVKQIFNVLLGSNLSGNLTPLSMLPGVRDFVSMLQGYSISRADAESIQKFVQAGETLINSLGDGSKTIAYAAKELVEATGRLFGNGAANALRDIYGIGHAIAVETDNIRAMYWLDSLIYEVGATANKGRYMDLCYKAAKLDDSGGFTYVLGELKDAGHDEKDIRDAVRDRVKKAFEDGELEQSKAVAILTKYCGKTTAEAMADVQYWAYRRHYPDTEADDAWFDTFYEKVVKSGITIEVYVQYRSKVADITGENKKVRRMAVIDSLPLTAAQKDALYLAEGWAESTIGEAPWH